MESEKSTEDLPANVLVEILSYLSVEDLVHSARHVCTRWRDLYGDVVLWRKLVYRPENDDPVVKILKQTPKLQTIYLNKRIHELDVLTVLVENCPHLRKIVFNPFQKFSEKYLQTLVEKCPNLESLNVPCGDPVILDNMEAIGQLSNLTEIKVGPCVTRHTVTLKSLADGCPLLQRCYINTFVTYDDFAYFINKKKDVLKELHIYWNSNEGKCLIPLLTICTRLRKLVVLNHFHIDAIEDIHALSSLHTLTSLTLNYMGFPEVNNMMDMFKEYKSNHLEELTIYLYHKCKDTWMDVFVKNCPKLKSYSLKCYGFI